MLPQAGVDMHRNETLRALHRDLDGTGASYGAVNILRFQNTTLADFSAQNFIDDSSQVYPPNGTGGLTLPTRSLVMLTSRANGCGMSSS